MKRKKKQRLTTSNRMILSTLIFVTVAFVAMISIVANILFTNSIENSKKIDTENANHLTASLNDSFDNIVRLLSLAQQSLEEFDFQDGLAHESVGNMLTTLLELNPDAHSAWFVAEPGIHHENMHCIIEYLRHDGEIIENSAQTINYYLKDPRNSPWYYKPLKTGKPHLETQNLYDYGTGDDPVYNAMISIPIHKDGIVIGVCGIDVIYKDILDLKDLQSEQNRVVMLIGRDLTVLHAYDHDLIGKNLTEFNFNDFDGLRSAIANKESYDKEIMGLVSQERTFLYFQPIFFSIDPEHPIYLYIGTPMSALYSSIYEIEFVLIAVSSICMICILFIIFYNVRRIILPIRKLTRQAQQITNGDLRFYDIDLKEKQPDEKNEVAVLRHSFVKVLQALQVNLHSVENRVRERTHDLEKLNNYINILMESNINVSILVDRDLNILYCNKTFLDLICVKDAYEIIGKCMNDKFAEFPDQDCVRRTRQRINRLLSGEEHFVEDDVMYWPNGTKRLYRIFYNQVRDMDNNLEGMVINMQDLTDVRLEEAQRRQDDLIYSTKIPCMVWNEKGEIVAYNEEFPRAFHLPADLPLDEPEKILTFIEEEIQPNGQRTVDIRRKIVINAINNGFAQANVRLRKGDGAPAFYLINVARISWLSEYRLVVYCYDKTELVLKEAEAREAEESIRLMLDSNPMICFMRDAENNIIDCNQEAIKIVGVSDKSELCEYANQYRHLPEYQPDGTKSTDMVSDFIGALLRDGFVDSKEIVFLTATGELIPVETNFIKINWKDSYRILSYSRDLRKEKADEQKMLEGLERERALIIQTEAAQAANETKNQFIANISHEIRTPMNAVLGMSELLLQENLNERQHSYAKDIKTSAEALLDIINDILDISKIQAGKLNLVPVHYDFKSMIENLNSIARFLVEDKDILFDMNVEGDIPHYLYGDDIRLRQILLNLLGNAVKFTGEGSVSLTVGATDTSVHFTVSDTGMGIKPEDIGRLFEAFEQFDARKNRDKCGTGLGLSITKALIELMKGRIDVESVYGHGASFHVVIPKILGDETLVRNAGDRDIVIYAPDAKILIVDDNKINLNVACGLLRLCQIDAVVAHSGRQAIEMAMINHYDIIFMDHMMPEMDGLEATKIIRELGIETPIIALTASAVTGTKELMMAAGMDDYLSKPIITSRLKAILRKWLPAEKQLRTYSAEGEAERDGNDNMDFWDKIGQIEGISTTAGLERVEGEREAYGQMLKLMIKEIEKCDRNLKEFLEAGDMRNFCIEVHSIKSSLAIIGALELRKYAYELELASGREDADYCKNNLPQLLNGLNKLYVGLKDAFGGMEYGDGTIEIPPELPPLLRRLMEAFSDMDIIAIDEGVEELADMSFTGALGDEIEQISEAAIMTDFDYAIEIIQRLLSIPSQRQSERNR